MNAPSCTNYVLTLDIDDTHSMGEPYEDDVDQLPHPLRLNEGPDVTDPILHDLMEAKAAMDDGTEDGQIHRNVLEKIGSGGTCTVFLLTRTGKVRCLSLRFLCGRSVPVVLCGRSILQQYYHTL